jgi:aminocarboxymuconate-semialdehyde decarboxylase
VKIVHPHLGATVPFLAARIDFESARPWAGNRSLERAPSEYLREFWTDTVSRSPEGLALARGFYGPERIMLATDFPWWPADEGVALVRENGGEHLDAFLGGNARRLLGL